MRRAHIRANPQRGPGRSSGHRVRMTSDEPQCGQCLGGVGLATRSSHSLPHFLHFNKSFTPQVGLGTVEGDRAGAVEATVPGV
ncbi:MAG: hypothetical protein K6U08_00535 [Firmicutes bacterium]|nr:hypothetical protein [Bacillota bacterium]